LDGPEYLYVSVDVDVMDPAFAAGTRTSEPGGLTPRELLPAVRRICHETPAVGFEVVEVAPLLDPGITTVMNACRIILKPHWAGAAQAGYQGDELSGRGYGW
jgi:agmatinase